MISYSDVPHKSHRNLSNCDFIYRGQPVKNAQLWTENIQSAISNRKIEACFFCVLTSRHARGSCYTELAKIQLIQARSLEALRLKGPPNLANLTDDSIYIRMYSVPITFISMIRDDYCVILSDDKSTFCTEYFHAWINKNSNQIATKMCKKEDCRLQFALKF